MLRVWQWPVYLVRWFVRPLKFISIYESIRNADGQYIFVNSVDIMAVIVMLFIKVERKYISKKNFLFLSASLSQIKKKNDKKNHVFDIHTGFCRPVSTPLARISISPKIPKSHINFVFEKRYPAEQIQQHIQQQIRQKFTNPEAIWPLKPQAIVGTSTIPDQQHRSAFFIPEVVAWKLVCFILEIIRKEIYHKTGRNDLNSMKSFYLFF